MIHMIHSRLTMAVAVTATLLAGCASVGPWDSQEVAKLSATNARMVAGDVVEILVSEYAPGQTTFALANGKPGTFGMALESNLREMGYAISLAGERKPGHALRLAYILDELGQPGTYRVGVRVEPTYRMDRMYFIDSTGTLIRGSGTTVRDGADRETVYPPDPETGPDVVKPPQPVSMLSPSAEKASFLEYEKPDLEQSWQVQVMAGTNRYDLEFNKNRLGWRGREAHIVPVGTSGRLRALRIGPFDTATEARSVMRTMRAHYYADAFLVEPKRGDQ